MDRFLEFICQKTAVVFGDKTVYIVVQRLADKLRKGVSEGARSIAVFIGPEGGFESSEVDAVIQAGGEEISLGHRILRTETAAIAVLSHLMMTIEGCTDGSIS